MMQKTRLHAGRCESPPAFLRKQEGGRSNLSFLLTLPLICSLAMGPAPAYALREQQTEHKAGLEEIKSALLNTLPNEVRQAGSSLARAIFPPTLTPAAGLEEKSVEELAEVLRKAGGFGFVDLLNPEFHEEQVPLLGHIAIFIERGIMEEGLILKLNIEGLGGSPSMNFLDLLRDLHPDTVLAVALSDPSQIPPILRAAQRKNLILTAPVEIAPSVVEQIKRDGLDDRILVIAKVRNWDEIQRADSEGARGIEIEPAAQPKGNLEATLSLLERVNQAVSTRELKNVRIGGSAGGVTAENVAPLLARGYVGFSVGPKSLQEKLGWFQAQRAAVEAQREARAPKDTARPEERRLRSVLLVGKDWKSVASLASMIGHIRQEVDVRMVHLFELTKALDENPDGILFAGKNTEEVADLLKGIPDPIKRRIHKKGYFLGAVEKPYGLLKVIRALEFLEQHVPPSAAGLEEGWQILEEISQAKVPAINKLGDWLYQGAKGVEQLLPDAKQLAEALAANLAHEETEVRKSTQLAVSRFFRPISHEQFHQALLESNVVALSVANLARNETPEDLVVRMYADSSLGLMLNHERFYPVIASQIPLLAKFATGREFNADTRMRVWRKLKGLASGVPSHESFRQALAHLPPELLDAETIRHGTLRQALEEASPERAEPGTEGTGTESPPTAGLEGDQGSLKAELEQAVNQIRPEIEHENWDDALKLLENNFGGRVTKESFADPELGPLLLELRWYGVQAMTRPHLLAAEDLAPEAVDQLLTAVSAMPKLLAPPVPFRPESQREIQGLYLDILQVLTAFGGLRADVVAEELLNPNYQLPRGTVWRIILNALYNEMLSAMKNIHESSSIPVHQTPFQEIFAKEMLAFALAFSAWPDPNGFLDPEREAVGLLTQAHVLIGAYADWMGESHALPEEAEALTEPFLKAMHEVGLPFGLVTPLPGEHQKLVERGAKFLSVMAREAGLKLTADNIEAAPQWMKTPAVDKALLSLFKSDDSPAEPPAWPPPADPRAAGLEEKEKLLAADRALGKAISSKPDSQERWLPFLTVVREALGKLQSAGYGQMPGNHLQEFFGRRKQLQRMLEERNRQRPKAKGFYATRGAGILQEAAGKLGVASDQTVSEQLVAFWDELRKFRNREWHAILNPPSDSTSAGLEEEWKERLATLGGVAFELWVRTSPEQEEGLAKVLEEKREEFETMGFDPQPLLRLILGEEGALPELISSYPENSRARRRLMILTFAIPAILKVWEPTQPSLDAVLFAFYTKPEEGYSSMLGPFAKRFEETIEGVIPKADRNEAQDLILQLLKLVHAAGLEGTFQAMDRFLPRMEDTTVPVTGRLLMDRLVEILRSGDSVGLGAVQYGFSKFAEVQLPTEVLPESQVFGERVFHTLRLMEKAPAATSAAEEIVFPPADKDQKKEPAPSREVEVYDYDLSDEEMAQVQQMIGQVRVLEREEATFLFRALHAKNLASDLREGLSNFLIEANIPLVRTWLKTHGYRKRGDPDRYEDAFQNGVLGLFPAVAQFDYRKGTRFATYAEYWIRQGVQRGGGVVPGPVRVPEHWRSDMAAYQRAAVELSHELKKRPSDEQIAERLNWDLDRVVEIRTFLSKAASLDTPVRGGEGEERPFSTLFAQIDRPEDLAAASELADRIRAILSSLSSEERLVMKMRYGVPDGWVYTKEEIAQKTGFNPQEVSDFERSAVEKLAIPPTPGQGKGFSDDGSDLFLVETMGVPYRHPLFPILQPLGQHHLARIWATLEQSSPAKPVPGTKKRFAAGLEEKGQELRLTRRAFLTGAVGGLVAGLLGTKVVEELSMPPPVEGVPRQILKDAAASIRRLGVKSTVPTGKAHILYNEASLAILPFIHTSFAQPKQGPFPHIAVVDPLRRSILRSVAEGVYYSSGTIYEEVVDDWERDYIVVYDPQVPGDIERATQEAQERIARLLPGVKPEPIFSLPKALDAFGAELKALLQSLGLVFKRNISAALDEKTVQALYWLSQA